MQMFEKIARQYPPIGIQQLAVIIKKQDYLRNKR